MSLRFLLSFYSEEWPLDLKNRPLSVTLNTVKGGLLLSPNEKEKMDDDILKCREDVLRARDIMPPYDDDSKDDLSESGQQVKKKLSVEGKTKDKSTLTEGEEGKTQNQKTSAEPQKLSSQKAQSSKKAQTGQKEAHDNRGQVNNIPHLDLGKDITPAERKSVSNRRKGPGESPDMPKPQIREIDTSGKSGNYTADEHDRIIREIVARDISKLRKGQSLQRTAN